jgi:hypothetical protein
MRLRKFLQVWILITRVADPYSFDTDTDPDPAFLAEYLNGSRGFDDQKLEKIYS